MPVLGVGGPDEVIEVASGKRVRLEREVLVGSEIVDPKRACPRRFTGRLAVKKEDVRLYALSVEDSRGKSQQRVDIAIVQQALPYGFARAALKQDVVG